MPKFIVWNTNRKEDFTPAADLAIQEEADFLVLLETRFDISKFGKSLNEAKKSPQTYYCSNNSHGKSDIFLFTRWPVAFITPLEPSGEGVGRMKAWRIGLPVEKSELLLFAVHGPDRIQYKEEWQRLLQAQSIKTSIEAVVAKHPESIGTLIMGDFNMNPFETGMVARSGFDSLACWRQLSRRRNPGGYYNPTWSLFGDRCKGPPGTYFFQNRKDGELSWHILDQLLLSKSIMGRLRTLEVPKRAGATPLRKRNSRKPTVSDHFPLVFELAGG